MNILVLVKRVPDTASKIKVAADQKTIEEGGVQFVLNPFDEYAVEAALQLKEKAGAGSVVVGTLGPKDAAATIRTALAMGADSGLHVKDDMQLRDPMSIARSLASAIEKLDPKPELILAGRQAVDSQAMAVGPMVATLLGYPCVTDINKLEVTDGKATVEHDVEGGTETLEVTLPALLTTAKGLNEPRYASLKGIMKAKRKKIVVSDVSVAEERTTITTMVEPPDRIGGKIVGEGVDAVPELVRLLREEAKAL
ncbi:electron transfer flavoprotein subunit beta/FixA family protein [Planctomycetota bacterium]